ncbi:hypothetical protein Q9233_017618 [Columba guinea]|nr:hypothetical protein Q9233_017618 [Columba guinea]
MRKVRNMMELLERVESSYIPAFKTMLMDVEAALTEAQDVRLHLMPLKCRLEDIERVEFSEVKPFLLPLLHVVCLIWVTSKHYNMPVRIVVLLQEICNLLIEQALVYLSPEDLLKGDMEESLGKVRMVLGILNTFKEAFEERREKLHTYYEPGQEVREWDFNSTMVFVRLDTFLKRLEMVEDLLATALDLMKLEKIEFSGIKGKTLGQQVLDMYEEFQEAYKLFSERTYDCLDLTNMDFEQDAFGFQQKVEDIDRRLGTVFIQAFDDASDLEHAFKLLDMFGSLLERPVIAADAADKYSVLISMFSRALDHARLIYSRHIQTELKLGSPPVHKNMPPVAGALCWARELRARIQVPFDHFRRIPHLCVSVPAKLLYDHLDSFSLINLIFFLWYQEKLYADWSQTVSEKSQYNLTQPLIRRDPETKLVTVNFDPQLVLVLREVSYLSGSRLGAIPPPAAEIYSSKESYRQLAANLELMVNRYNKVLKTVLEWGKGLTEGAQELSPAALKKSSQSSHFLPGVWDHISMVMDDVHDLEQRIQKAKNNVEEIQTIVGSWASPIFVRRDCKTESLLSLEDCQDRLERRYSLVRESGQRIHLLVKENQSLLLADPASDIWKAYVDYVDEIVLDGFFTAIECSLKYLLENTDPKAGLAPLFEVQLDLVIPDLIFQPSLDPGTNDGFYNMVEGLLHDIYRISSLVPRLAEHSGFLHYQVRGCGAPSCWWQ